MNSRPETRTSRKPVPPAVGSVGAGNPHVDPSRVHPVNIVADYIERKWVFAVIQLVREQTGPNTPHPARLSFKSSEAVYPMRLTALAGGDPYFELFVIADQRADCNQLATGFTDQFTRRTTNFN
jgi:hypothetical protein